MFMRRSGQCIAGQTLHKAISSASPPSDAIKKCEPSRDRAGGIRRSAGNLGHVVVGPMWSDLAAAQINNATRRVQ